MQSYKVKEDAHGIPLTFKVQASCCGMRCYYFIISHIFLVVHISYMTTDDSESAHRLCNSLLLRASTERTDAINNTQAEKKQSHLFEQSDVSALLGIYAFSSQTFLLDCLPVSPPPTPPPHICYS